MLENGWKINIPANNIMVDGHVIYLCRCEKQMIVSSKEVAEPCEHCGNDLFLSLEAFHKSTQHLYMEHFQTSKRTYMDHKGWHSVVSYMLPSYAENVLSWTSVQLLRSSLLRDGTYETKVLEPYIEKKVTLQGVVAANLAMRLKEENRLTLYTFVKENLPSGLNWLTTALKSNSDVPLGMKIIRYCLQNPSTEEIDLFYWNDINVDHLKNHPTSENALLFLLNNRKEKSIRKALFSHYKESMSKETKHYDPTFDYVVLRLFDDPNYLTFLLSLNAYYKNHMFAGSNADTVLSTFQFFQEHYSERQLFTLIKESLKTRNIYNLWGDCFRMLAHPRTLPSFKEHFERQKPQVTLLHDELVRIQNQYVTAQKIDMLKPFDYKIPQLKAQIRYEELDFRLPGTGKELHAWGVALNNCMVSYASDIENNTTIIYGVFKQNKLTYAVEIQNNKIVQARAVNNGRVSDKERAILSNWRKETLTST